MGLNAETTGGVYDIYRKYQRSRSGEIHTAENVEGNPSQMRWIGIDQASAGFNTGFQAPGIFVGKTPSISSYEDNLVYFGQVLDIGDGADGSLSDSNMRRNWDLRFGFIEDPDGFVDIRDPNDGTWDMHAGSWGSEGVDFHFQIGADIDEDFDTGDMGWFTHPAGTPVHFYTQSGDPDTLIGSQGDRDPLEFTLRQVGSGTELDGLPDFHETIGVGYDDKVEVSWSMELYDPGNANAVRAREVKLSVKAGSVIYEGVFDPGSPTDEIFANELNDPDTPYTDGYFDWQNATPIMYMGAENQTVPGGELVHGVFIPGDLNADGTVDATDRAIIDANLDKIDTSYSRGDVNQDGVTNADDLAAWDSISGPDVAGDFNGNGTRDVGDLDLLATAMAANDLSFDLNSDGATDVADRIMWVEQLANTHIGDSNFDGEFSSADFVAVFGEAKYETGQSATWAAGDWNGDGVFSSSEFVTAFSGGGYENGPRDGGLQTVPEPSGVLLLALCGLSFSRRTR